MQPSQKKTGINFWIHAVALALLPLSLSLSLVPGPAQADDTEDEVRAVIEGLQSSWNAGDITAYLDAYRRDESMSLTFGNTVVQGWDALNSLFRDSYPDEVRMGKFTIDSTEVTVVGDDAAVAYGNFTHVFAEETIIGGYSHVLHRGSGGGWIIVHERTSRGEVVSTH